MAQDHFIAEFRHRTGMTQEALAALLRVNRSHLNMNERGERILPAEATLRLLQLIQQMNDAAFAAEAAAPPPTQEQKEKLKQQLLQHAAQKRNEADGLKKKIKAHEKSEAQRGQMRVLLAAMKHMQAQQKLTERETEWLALQESLGGFYYDYRDWEIETYQSNCLRYAMLLKEAEEAERMAGEM
jgi:transcriptional regulator with XRE-family HTH domain